MASRISEKSIKQLKAPRAGNIIAWDSEIPGFGVRITADSAVSFILDYRIFERRRRYTVGRYLEMTVAEARDNAIELRKDVRNGIDPMEERQKLRDEPTFADLATAYQASAEFTKQSKMHKYHVARRINKVLLPEFGKHRLTAIAKRDIEELHMSRQGTPVEANRILDHLRVLFKFAMGSKWIKENPAIGIAAFHEDQREAFLSVEQLERFFEALDGYEHQDAANCIRLLILTGAREGEALKAQWEEIDLIRGVWAKPSHHTKQKKQEYPPLSAEAIELLKAMKVKAVEAGNARRPLFPGREKGSRVTLRRPWVQLCKATGFVEIETYMGKRKKLLKRYKPTIRIHDLRHTFASHLVSNGFSLQIVGKLLGHTQASTTMRYAHVADEAQRAATNKLATIIRFPTSKTA